MASVWVAAKMTPLSWGARSEALAIHPEHPAVTDVTNMEYSAIADTASLAGSRASSTQHAAGTTVAVSSVSIVRRESGK